MLRVPYRHYQTSINVVVVKCFTVFGTPLVRPTGVCRRHEAERVHVVAILLAFGDEYRFAGGYRPQQFGQPIKHTPDAIKRLPEPIAVSIGPPLSEILGIKPHNLKQQNAFCSST